MTLAKLLDVVKIANRTVKPFEGVKYYLSTGNLDYNKISNLEEISYETRPSRANLIVKPNDVIFARMKDTVKVLRIDESNDDIIVSTGFCVLEPSEKICPEYLELFLKSVYFQKQKDKFATGAIQVALTNKGLEKIKIPLLPIQDQMLVSKILRKAEKLINLRKQQIEKLDELIQSVFYEMFGNLNGERCYLKEHIIINPPKREVGNLDENTIVSFVSMADVSENGEINTSNVKKLGEVYKGYTYFAENDVLFAKITPCMENGKGCIARNLVNGIGFGSTEFYVLRPKPNVKLTSEFLFYLTHSKKFRTLAEKNMTGSAGQKRVPKHFIENFKIVLPPQELQHKFTAIVERIEKKKELMKQSLKLMEDNFNSLMQRAFRGELV